MLRAVASFARTGLVGAARMVKPQSQASRPFSALSNNALFGSHGKVESDAEFDQRYIDYFNNQDIDGWWIRKYMTDLQGQDMVPEPPVIIAALHACRRINDYALSVRILESIYEKCGPAKSTIWPYIVQEIKPTCEELGILLPEEMGYDQPELWKDDSWMMPA